jgi:Na+-translocating ferredoxin:NAD+ oxidoreductase RnfC subunit
MGDVGIVNDLDRIRDAGVVGAGGAGFPTWAKLNARAEIVILNGAECEPLLRVDQYLMENFPKQVILGLDAARACTGAERALIGIKGKHGEAVGALRGAIADENLGGAIEVRVLKDVYPAGDEQILVYELTGRIVPETGIPLNVKCVVINVETALNIEAALRGVPVTRKWLTVAGAAPRPVTLSVPVGTPIAHVLAVAGVTDAESVAVLDGGPMMGSLLRGVEGYVTKKTKGFVVLPKSHPLVARKSATGEQALRKGRAACEQCRMCTDLCPRFLLGHNMQPHRIMRAIAYETLNPDGQKTVALCSQCGLCELFSCPIGLYPKLANLHFRAKMAEKKIQYKSPEKSYAARAFRDFRMVSTKRLIRRLGLAPYDGPAPFREDAAEAGEVGIMPAQHVGAPAEVCVRAGERVVEGQIIGKAPDGALCAPVHASVGGFVASADGRLIIVKRD